MTQKQRLVVIGNGMAGARLVEEVLARHGSDLFEIIVFGDEPYGNYNRILLSGVLAGTHDAQDIFINPLAWYEENGITLHVGQPVCEIDRAARTVRTAAGLVERYDKLVIATGSSPFVPELENLASEHGAAFKDGTFVFRTMDDCAKMIEFAPRAKRAAVIGGGLLGLEAARGLLNRELDVHVVHVKEHPMNVQLDQPAGAMLAKSLKDMGVNLHLGKRTTGILGNGHVTGLAFHDGSELACDMLVISAGIRPNAELARQAGLLVEQGIVVNDDLTCPGAPGIYALGECSQHRGQLYGLVAPLWEQAQILADRLTSEVSESIYEGSRVSTKLKVMGVDVAVMGEKDAFHPNDEIVTYADPASGIYKKLIIRDNQLVGAILMGDGHAAPKLLQAFERKAPLPANRAELLFALSGDKGLGVADLPDDAQICNCNGVSKGKIIAAVRAGKRSLKMLCDATRAGTGCGSCKSQVQELLELASDGQMVDDPSIHYYVPGVQYTKPELIKLIQEQGLRSVSSVFAALAGGKEDAKSKVGLASLLKTIWGKDYEDERDARFINDRVHANIQNDGTFSVIPRIYGGVTSPQQLRRIADVAEKHKVPMLKITGGQRIDMLGIAKEKLPEVWQDLGMPSGHAYAKTFRTCKTCVGSEFCRYGVGDSTALGIKIEQRFQGIESPHKMKLAVSGCPRNCAEATIKDVGAVAIEGGRWEVHIGGAGGSTVRKSDILCVADTQEDVLLYMGRFMQYYRENAKYLERTHGLVERMGVERLKSLLVDDCDGICARLDQAMQAAVDAYKDPWLEAETPNTPNQFANVIETVEKVAVLQA